MEKLNVVDRIHELKFKKGWTDYELAKQAGIAQGTLYGWKNKHLTPSTDTIFNICEAFGITMSQFFADDEKTERTIEETYFCERFSKLNPAQKEVISSLLKSFGV